MAKHLANTCLSAGAPTRKGLIMEWEGLCFVVSIDGWEPGRRGLKIPQKKIIIIKREERERRVGRLAGVPR